MDLVDTDVAIVGLALRVPGAATPAQLWDLLCAGREGLVDLDDAALRTAGVSDIDLTDPNYVKRGGPLAGFADFDAELFGFSPADAAIMDPQHRTFLQCALEAIEDAGHPPERFEGAIGVFAGCGMNSYFMRNLLQNRELCDSVGLFLLRHTGNDKDFLATRVSHVFDLKGPSLSIQTACSTSLVAVHVACQSLINRECDMALAGGVTIEIPHGHGYRYTEGEILAPDGHCYAFDHRAKGTVFGSGAGVVVLRRLADALAAGDHIYAVVKGTAINNDGASKAGYLAPSIDGQAAAIAEAHAVAGVRPETIGYIETHGTGTPVGDSIEVAALKESFRGVKGTRLCALGSIKTNLGHLDTAAGVAGLIKAALMLQHEQMPPSLNFAKPNPALGLEQSPFFVNTELRPWPRGPKPRFAAVNSLGVGGTNAHAVLAEAPATPPVEPSKRTAHVLVLSAKSKKALDAGAARLAAHLEHHPEQPLADVAYTLAAGRRALPERRVLAVRDREEASRLLAANDPQRVFTHTRLAGAAVAFLLPGGGCQSPQMAAGLYAHQPAFRAALDQVLTILRDRWQCDLRPLLFAHPERYAQVAAELEQPARQLPAIFAVEWALAECLRAQGIVPTALLGHSLGENTAACLAGVLSLEAACGLVVLRGQLFERTPPGAMLSVPLPEAELRALLPAELDLATINGPSLCTVSGPVPAIEQFERSLQARELECRRVRIRLAPHSRLLEPILADFRAYLTSIKLAPPRIPFVSNRTGTWITDAEATNPEYWVQHLRNPVQFAAGVATLLERPGRVLLEVGPGRTLTSLAGMHAVVQSTRCAIPLLPAPDDPTPDEVVFSTALGRLWACGLPCDLTQLYAGENRRRVVLPTYPFQQQRYWIDPDPKAAVARDNAAPAKITDPAQWFWTPHWLPAPLPSAPSQAKTEHFLVFADAGGIGDRLAAQLRAHGHAVSVARAGDAYARIKDGEFTLAPEQGPEGYASLLRELIAAGKPPTRIAHLWLLTADERCRPGSSFLHRNLEQGLYSVLFIAQALAREDAIGAVDLTVIGNGFLGLAQPGVTWPEKATVLGPCRVLPRELPATTCRCVEVELPPPAKLWFGAAAKRHQQLDALATTLRAELTAAPHNATVAWRGSQRFQQGWERCSDYGSSAGWAQAVRPFGTYWIIGGLGGLGLALAEHLAAQVRGVKLVLTARRALPARLHWEEWLATHTPSDPISKQIGALLRLEGAGAEVLVASADIADVEAMRAVLTEVERRFGVVHGVLHTAGVLEDAPLAEKAPEAIERVLAPKVHGTLVLERVLGGTALDFLVLFSSTSAVIAPAGQVDYVAANAFLNAFAERHHGKTWRRCQAVLFGAFQGTGMAQALLGPDRTPAAQARATKSGHPWLRSSTEQAQGKITLHGQLDTQAFVLDEHRTAAGHALLPGTGYLELARAALAELGEQHAFEIRDLYFFQPLFVSDDRTCELAVCLTPTPSGFTAAVRTKHAASDGRVGYACHAQANLCVKLDTEPGTLDLPAIQARCRREIWPASEAGIRTSQELHLRFGPRWRVLRQALFGNGEALARVALPAAFAAEAAAYPLHPALLDLATGYCLPLVAGYQGRDDLWVPVSYRRVVVHGPLPAEVWSWARHRGCTDQGFANFDVTVCDSRGAVLVEIFGFAMRRLAALAAFAPPANVPDQDLEFEGGRTGLQGPGERQLRWVVSQGLTPAEGAQALARLLAAPPRPQVAVSSLDLEALQRQVADPVPALAKTKGFARPELAVNFVEPRDDLERTLAGYWKELLGADRIGVEDSFFDLGGHSLIAVRLFAKIKKAWQVDWPISVLFEAPTIAACAARIREATHAGATDAPPAPRWTYLVPMHQNRRSTRTPFFLVAGMFGNVLNLRHLAHLAGHDRPFYGIQARGLYGGHAPHERFEDMARDYLVEVRQVQPHGPYLIGGFSGGGITAFEMARQLRAAGEAIALLVMIDAPLPKAPELSRADRWRIHAQRLQTQGPRYLTQWAVKRWQWEFGKLRQALVGDSREYRPAEFHNEVIEKSFRRALAAYVLLPEAVRVALFRPPLDRAHDLGDGRWANQARELVFEDNGWSRFVRELDVYVTPGNHDSMVLEPNVRVLAAKLRGCLEAAERPSAVPTMPGKVRVQPASLSLA